MPSSIQGGYLPPGVYTETSYGTSPTPAVVPDQITVYVGTGQESRTRSNLAVVRGSSSAFDQQVVSENTTGRAVAAIRPDGAIELGAWDGTRNRFQVRNFPLVTGDGTGTPATDSAAVTVTLNGLPVVVLGVVATTGLVELAVAPEATDVVACTYYFNRTDTLTTDDVSAQVTPGLAIIDGQTGQSFSFTASVNDRLILSVDGGAFLSIAMPTTATSVSASVVVAAINAVSGRGTLVASSYVDNYGATCLRLTAARSLTIGTGTANTVLGLVSGATTSRNRTFYTFNGPLVTGNNGGITTTNPSDVTVLVNGIQVIPTAVDGATRAVTLPVAPEDDATVTIRYYWNTWQDTFDYLANVGVTSITRVGMTPDGGAASTYVGGVSYVLKDDRILWGTAALTRAGLTTDGSLPFGPTQVTASLVDTRRYMAPCVATVDTSSPVSVASRRVFQLPAQPTTGNGRGSPLSSTTYGRVTNGRLDLPTTRPDLIQVYWGYGVTDALTRGPVTVVAVDPVTSTVTLAADVPDGASVYATYYYNTLVDAAFIGSSRGYTLTTIASSVGGLGTYRITDGTGNARYGVRLLGKGSDLSSVTVNFPSGSEFFPDARIEGGIPVEETVTVTLATSDATPARYSSPGQAPFYLVTGASDRLRLTVDGSAQQTGAAGGVLLSSPTGSSRRGAFASLVGNEVVYTAASGETTYDITAAVDDVINLLVDGVAFSATATAATGTTVASYVTAINAAAIASGNEPVLLSAGAFPNGYTVAANAGNTLRLHYTGATGGASGIQTITLANGTYATAAALATQINTQLASINGVSGLLGSVTCTATADARLRFRLTLGAGDASGYLEFIQGTIAATAGVVTGSTVLGTIDIEPAATLVVTVDGGAPATTTFSATAAAITGTGASYAPVTAGHVLNLTINGTPYTVTFTGAEASQGDFHTAITTVITAVATVSNVGGQTRIATARRGTGANVTVVGTTSASVLSSLGLTSGQTNTGTGNVANIDAVTSSELLSLVNTALGVTATASLDGSNHFRVTSATTGTSSSVQFTAGTVTTALGLATTAGTGAAAIPTADFAVVAGLDTDTAANGAQTKLYNGPIARRFTVATTGSRLPYDRIILRNRIFPGWSTVTGHSFLAQTRLLSQGGSGAAKAGLPAGLYGDATLGGVLLGASMVGVCGWDGGVSGTGQPVVTFYNGTDPLYPANNVFVVTANGTTVTTTFTSSSSGTATALGPAATSGTILAQLTAAISAAGVSSTVTVTPEGAGFRLVATPTGPTSSLTIGTGTANDILGFAAGDSSTPVSVTAESLASTLMSHAQASGSFATFMNSYASPASGYFAGRALARAQYDATGASSLYVQSLTLGASSSLAWAAASSASALSTGTGLGIAAGDGASGRATLNGFYVTSSDPVSGSGSANTSVFNSGTGADGAVGSTYVDEVTGLTFTILPRTGGLAYPTGTNATLRFRVSSTQVTDGTIPNLTIPGVELNVTDTYNVTPGDTALVETFKKDGPEPAIGEVYYVSYVYAKQDYSPRLFSRLNDVTAEYGPVSPDNPLSLAAYFAFLNGSSVVGMAQVRRTAGATTASEQAYRDAIDSLAGNSLPGNVSPTVIVPLTPATLTLSRHLAIHCDVQSSIRYRAERTAIFGFASGTRPNQATALARSTGSMRVRFVYPDMATLTLTDVLGNDRDYLVDGRYIAAALAASTTSPTVDSATPWEGRRLIGFTSLGRQLDAVTANQVANQGVTIVEYRPPFLRVRHGLTSDMTDVLTRTPTVTQIADDIHRRARAVLDAFIGVKFLPQILGQIEGRLCEMFKRAVAEQIIASFAGVRVSLDPEDPTAIQVEAFYRPVFPLLYIRLLMRISSR